MSKYDVYLYEGSHVLRNLLNIQDEKELDLAEAELSRANMMVLYENGFSDFSAHGVSEIHRILFEDVYEWAGKFRVINIQKREDILGGKSVWYSDCDSIEGDLEKIFDEINQVDWKHITKNEFVSETVKFFSRICRVHPFREGNTRTVTMLIAFFVESHGYYFDHELISKSAGYFRNALVMESLDQFSEYEYLENILSDAISTEPIETEVNQCISEERSEKYKKYKSENYRPTSHEYIDK